MRVYLFVLYAFILVVLVEPALHAQFRPRKNKPATSWFVEDKPQRTGVIEWFLPGLKADKETVVYKPASPAMSLPASTSALMGEAYWVGSVTSQSYNQGKIGRYYYWDVQGNLRGSYLFLDIAGKNKRGLKLVFPKHRAIF